MTSRRSCRMRGQHGVQLALGVLLQESRQLVGSRRVGHLVVHLVPSKVVIVETSSMNSASLLPKCL